MTTIKESNKFIPLYYDVLFYKVFGDDEDTEPLKWLIKQILNIEVVDVQILNGKVLGEMYKTKRSYLDLLVKLKDNTKEVKSNTIREIAINMIKMGMNDEDIYKVTGLTMNEINKLK